MIELLERPATKKQTSTVGATMKRDDIPDFHAVKFIHEGIHARLENWARYVQSSGRGSGAAPMFRHYRSSDVWHDTMIAVPIDTLDGSRMEKAVGALPETHMYAIRWSYVYCRRGLSLGKVCRLLAVRQDTLHRLIEDGRTMLRNRGA